MAGQIVVNIIPTYNEVGNISKLLEAYLSVSTRIKNYKMLILVVDDNSPDGTANIVKSFQKSNNSIYLLSGPKRGLGRAMIRGLKFAVKTLKADIVIPNEADFAYHPKLIPQVLKKIESGYDVVVASRHVPGGSTHGWTTARKLNHWVANKVLATWVAGTYEVTDHNGAFRGVRVRGVLDKINLNKLDTNGFGFFNYFLFKLTQVTDKFYEFPVVYQFRTAGESKVSFNPKYIKTYLRDVMEYIMLCLKIRFERFT